MIYLDNAASTRVLPQSAKAAAKANAEYFFNPSALYRKAEEAAKEIESARQTVADALCCGKDEIYFTSGATESNNWAVFAGGLKRQKLCAVSSLGEHAAVYESMLALEQRGVKTHFSPLNADTSVKAEKFIELATQNCGFVSLIHASNETGILNDIGVIFSEIKNKNKNAILHSDGVQAFCKIPSDVKKMGVDLYSISGHKIGAPKGIGALYIKKDLNLRPFLYGGGQEKGKRSGTENISGIVAFATAVKEFEQMYKSEIMQKMRKDFFDIVSSACPNISLNGSIENSVPNILSFSISSFKAEILQRTLEKDHNIIVGLGSACAASKKGNRVLLAANKPQKEIHGNIRVSFSVETTYDEVIQAAKKIVLSIK